MLKVTIKVLGLGKGFEPSRPFAGVKPSTHPFSKMGWELFKRI